MHRAFFLLRFAVEIQLFENSTAFYKAAQMQACALHFVCYSFIVRIFLVALVQQHTCILSLNKLTKKENEKKNYNNRISHLCALMLRIKYYQWKYKMYTAICVHVLVFCLLACLPACCLSVAMRVCVLVLVCMFLRIDVLISFIFNFRTHLSSFGFVEVLPC